MIKTSLATWRLSVETSKIADFNAQSLFYIPSKAMSGQQARELMPRLVINEVQSTAKVSLTNLYKVFNIPTELFIMVRLVTFFLQYFKKPFHSNPSHSIGRFTGISTNMYLQELLSMRGFHFVRCVCCISFCHCDSSSHIPIQLDQFLLINS